MITRFCEFYFSCSEAQKAYLLMLLVVALFLVAAAIASTESY